MKNAFAATALVGVAAAYAPYTDGPTIQRGCLLENAQDVGSRSNDLAHYDFYQRSQLSTANIPSHYRIMQTVVCVDYNDPTWYGRFTGLSFTLADPANLDWETDGEWIKLPWLGYQTETCQALEVGGPITNIQTYSDNNVDGIGFWADGWDIAYNI